MTAYVALNLHSLVGAGQASEDSSLLERLALAFDSLRQAVPVHQADYVRVCSPQQPFILQLPGGTRLSAALKVLESRNRDRASRLRSDLTRGVAYDGNGDPIDVPLVREGVVYMNGALVPTLRTAWVLKGIAWSADRNGWQCPELLIEVAEPEKPTRPEKLANLWTNKILIHHRRALESTGLRPLPRYQNPGTHDPDARGEAHQEYIKYKGKKSEIPRAAESLLRHAVYEGGEKETWWARCQCGFFHRFQGSAGAGDVWAEVHWNGTTDERAYGNQDAKGRTTKEHVPEHVREQLEYLDPVENCGCR